MTTYEIWGNPTPWRARHLAGCCSTSQQAEIERLGMEIDSQEDGLPTAYEIKEVED